MNKVVSKAAWLEARMALQYHKLKKLPLLGAKAGLLERDANIQ